MPERSWLREIDHTADVGIEVTAPTVKSLFERAATGMFTILASADDVRAVESLHLSVEAPDQDALLVQWLSELNYLHQVESLIFSRFEIESIDEKQLVAIVSGERFDPDRHEIHCEIKAVTFHDLKMHRENDGWSVRIIFDM